ncbi:MAG: efflux RND transporter periplasmic adaptor subunit [Magnetococcus sp. YQC-3]
MKTIRFILFFSLLSGHVWAAVLTVQTVTPQTRPWASVQQASGTIAAWQESVVAAETGGLAITELAVDVGSVVQKGQLLVRLSQESVKATLAQQRANLARAQASLTEAVGNAKRARVVTGSGALSEQQIQQYLIAEKSSRAAVSAAEAAVQMEEVRMRQTEIEAVDDGIISARTATLGSVVQPGMELFRLLRQGRLEWRAELTAEQLLTVQPGQQARLHLPGGQTLEGRVRLLAPTLEPTTRKGIAYVDLPAGGPARAGMFAQGEIQIGSQPALTLPHAAVVLRDGHAYLFVVAGDSTVEQRKVSTGQRQGDWVEIRSGVAESDRVVAVGGGLSQTGGPGAGDGYPF